MVIATFGPSTGWAGKTISYDNGVFTLEGHGVISATDVLTYDRQGHISWAYEGLKEWAEQVAGTSPLATPPLRTTEVAAQSAGARPLSASPTSAPPPAGNAVADKPKRPLYRRWWVIAAGVLVLLIVIAAISSAGSPTKETQPVAAQPAANTSSPTVTVTKTAQASPTTLTFSAAEKKYVSDIGSDTTTVGNALTSLSKEAQNYTGSASQQARLVVAMATIKATWGSWKDRSAPAARWKVVHRHWLAALRDYDKSVTLLARGIDHNNASYVTEAAHYMNTGRRQIELATASMQTIMAELAL